MTESQYTSLYGPTVGDSIRLADTDLFAKVEKITQDMVMRLLSVVVNQSVMVWDKIRMQHVITKPWQT